MDRRGRAAAAVGVLAVLLALVALAGGARRGSSAGSVHPLGLRIMADVVAIVAALIATVGVAGWIGALLTRGRWRRPADDEPVFPPLWKRLLGIVLPFAWIALAVRVVGGWRFADWWGQGQGGPEAGAPGFAGRRAPTATAVGIDWPLVVIVVVLVVAVAGSFGLVGRRQRDLHRRRGSAHAATAGDELEALRAAGLEELEREPDPRRAVIRAYTAMCQLLASSGLPRRPSETPYEFLARALQHLGAAADAAIRLTELFERAEFSVHPITGAFKDEAIEAVRGLQVQADAHIDSDGDAEASRPTADPAGAGAP